MGRLAFIAAVVAAAPVAAQDAVIEHTAPFETEAHGSLRIEAKVREVWEPVKLVLNVRPAGQAKFERVPMGVEEIKIEGSGSATVAAGPAGELAFFIEALDLAGSPVVTDGSAKKPHLIKVVNPSARRRQRAREQWKAMGGAKDPCREQVDPDETARLARLLACAEGEFERQYAKVRPAARRVVDAYEEAEAELSELAQCALGDGAPLMGYSLTGLLASVRAAEAVASVSEKPVVSGKPQVLASPDGAMKAAADAFGQSERCAGRAADLLSAADRWAAARDGICEQVPRPRRIDCKLAMDAVRVQRLAELERAAR
jgi:hypothetical protein